MPWFNVSARITAAAGTLELYYVCDSGGGGIACADSAPPAPPRDLGDGSGPQPGCASPLGSSSVHCDDPSVGGRLFVYAMPSHWVGCVRYTLTLQF